MYQFALTKTKRLIDLMQYGEVFLVDNRDLSMTALVFR